METPKSIESNEPDYAPKAWQDYEIHELGMWVHLLVKRAGMRSASAQDKAEKDLADAQAYLDMMQSHIDSQRKTLGETA